MDLFVSLLQAKKHGHLIVCMYFMMLILVYY